MFLASNSINAVLTPEDVPLHFQLIGSRLYRKHVDGTLRQLKSMDGLKVVTLFRTARILAVDIAWCLHRGNWPMFPIVQIGDDPLDFSENNLYAARTRQLRYRIMPNERGFSHNLASGYFRTVQECRASWESCARSFYAGDQAMIYSLEADQRRLRAQYLADMAALKKSNIHNPDPMPAVRKRPERPFKGPAHAKPPKPRAIPGREWHWYMGEWVDVPEAVHVADDYRVRIQKWKLGARRFEFCPARQMVLGYDLGGNEVLMPGKIEK